MKTPHGDPDRWLDPARSNARRSVFAQNLVVDGDATSSGAIEVQGNVVGSLRAPEIIVAGSGRVEGSVVAHNIVVLGAVSGTVSALNVQLAPSARVQADVIHERIVTEAGAELGSACCQIASKIVSRNKGSTGALNEKLTQRGPLEAGVFVLLPKQIEPLLHNGADGGETTALNKRLRKSVLVIAKRDGRLNCHEHL